MNKQLMIAIFGIIGVILFISAILFGLPMYKVWERGKAGESELAQAEWNRQIAIREAEAELESAKLKALSEVERAKGVAEANRIVGESLKDNEAYLRYLWVSGLHDGTSEVIYVATEANLPILEASRFK